MTTVAQSNTAVGYFRVSTPGQAGERHVSLEAQQATFENYCRVHHLEPVATFTDIASGRKNDRAQYQAMLSYVAEHGVGHVVVLFLDRFGRNPREILRRYWELEETGTLVEATNEDLREELVLLIKAGVAGQESKRTSERTRIAIREAVLKRQYVNKPPYGYVKVRDQYGSRIEQVAQEAAVVRLMFELSTVRNLGFKSMANELNSLGHRTSRGGLFTAGTLNKLLRNPALAGTQVFGKRCLNPDGSRGPSPELIVNEGIYPAILSPEEWEALQERLEIRSEGSHHRGRTDVSPFLLSGTLRCGHCHRAIAGKSGGVVPKSHPKKKRVHKYYICVGRNSALSICTEQRNHKQGQLEEAVLKYLERYTEPDAVRQLLSAQLEASDARAETELKSISARLKELEQGFLNDLDRVDRNVMTEAEYLKRQEERRKEQEVLEVRKVELEPAVAIQRDLDEKCEKIPAKIRSFLADFRDMDIKEAKALLQGIIKTSHVYSDGRIEMEFR